MDVHTDEVKERNDGLPMDRNVDSLRRYSRTSDGIPENPGTSTPAALRGLG